MAGLTGRFARERASALALALLFTLLALLAPRFFSPGNLRDVVLANSAVLIVALGMTMVIIAGDVDVSVGATLGV